jgi:hypothetical protein
VSVRRITAVIAPSDRQGFPNSPKARPPERVNARTQRWLPAAEIVTPAAFAVVAVVRVGLGDGAMTPSSFSPPSPWARWVR